MPSFILSQEIVMPTSNSTPSTTTSQPRPAGRARALLVWTGRILLGLAIALVALGGVGATYQAVATALDRQAYPPTGQLVDVGGHRLHLHCVGQGSPTVVLESGLASPLPVWGWVQPDVAAVTRVCAYDRAGVGWSDAGPEPRDAQQMARELHTLLTVAGVPGPYVLVGHSYGGLYARVYAAMYPAEVAGVALIDSSHPDQWTSSPTAQAHYQRIEQVNAVGRLLARLGLLRALSFFPLNGDLPARQAAEYKAFVDTTAFADINAAEFAATAATSAQAQTAGGLGNRPLVVLTATDHGYGGGDTVSDEVRLQEEQWQGWQRELAGLSSDGSQRVVDGASHAALQIDRRHAGVTGAAIRQVVEAVRTGQPLTP
jgi:pimeloyl-ACP methyl ester carboxylesterase